MLTLACSTLFPLAYDGHADLSLMRRVAELHRELLGNGNLDTLRIRTWLAFIELSQDVKDDYGEASMMKISHSYDIIVGMVQLNKIMMGTKHPRTLRTCSL